MKAERLFTRNFTFLILGQISSLLGNYTLKFALSMYILEQTGSASVFAAMLAVAMLPTILLSPFGGILADRANRRWIMVGLDSLSGLTVLTAGLLLPFGSDLLVIGALLVVLSVLAAFESPTVQACIPQILSEDNLMRGNAAVNQAQAITSLVTPFLGSIIYAAFGLMPILWGAVACFFLTSFLECFIHLEFQKQEDSADLITIIKEDFSASVHFLRREQPAILKLLLLAAMASLFVAGTVVVGFPYLVRTVLGLSAEHYGGRSRERHGCRCCFGQLVCGCDGTETSGSLAGLCLFGAGAVPDSGGFCFCCAAGGLWRVSGAHGYVLHQPVWMQSGFHLCHFDHPGPHPGTPDGKGDGLCLHSVHVCPAGRSNDLWRSIRLVCPVSPMGAAAQRPAGMRDRPCLGALFPASGARLNETEIKNRNRRTWRL